MSNRPVITTLPAGGRYDTSTLNANFQVLRDAADDVVGNAGVEGSNNSMSGNLDMDDNNIINAGVIYNSAGLDITSSEASAASAASALIAEKYAEKTDGVVIPGATDYSSKAWAIGGTGVANNSKDYATKAEDSAVTGSDYSALHHAAKSAASASTASSAATSAASSLDTFDDRYLGAKGSAPSVDNDGDALVVGALYFNTSDNNTYVRNAANNAWITVSNNASAGTATTKAAEAAASAVVASNYAIKVDGVAAGSDHSAKAWAVGGTGITDTSSKGAAKEWATEAEDNTVDGSGYSALHWAAKATAQASAAVTAKNAAETAEGNAETAETAAEAAQTASVNAKNAAETAETAAEAAQAAAEAVANGISWKAPCLAATTENLAVNYSNGSSGVGATLTATSNGAISLDGIAPEATDRVLIKNQSAALQNGVYVVTTKGTGSAAFVLTRAVPMNAYAEFVGAIVAVSQGTVAADQAYICTADTGGTLGSDALPWSVFGVAPQAVTVTVDNYAAGSNFTAGSTTSLAMSVAAAAENDILVLFDGVYQHHNTFTVSSTTVSFSSAIPTGTLAVEIRGTSALAVGVPGAGTVGTSQLAAGPAKDLNALAVTNNLMYVGNGSNIVAESGATLRTSIGVGTGDSPQVTGVELGHATDTTLTRVSAGVVAIQGVTVSTSTRLINAQTGTTYTLALTDAGKIVTSSNANTQVVTIPPHGTIPFPTGTQIDIYNLGAGIASITGGTGVTLNGVSTGTGAMNAQYAAVTCFKIADNVWLMTGAHAAVA